MPGQFLGLQRTWKSNDRIELEVEMPLRLLAVDSENPDTMAPLRCPLALFAVGNIPAPDWTVKAETGAVTFRPLP